MSVETIGIGEIPDQVTSPEGNEGYCINEVQRIIGKAVDNSLSLKIFRDEEDSCKMIEFSVHHEIVTRAHIMAVLSKRYKDKAKVAYLKATIDEVKYVPEHEIYLAWGLQNNIFTNQQIQKIRFGKYTEESYMEQFCNPNIMRDHAEQFMNPRGKSYIQEIIHFERELDK